MTGPDPRGGSPHLTHPDLPAPLAGAAALLEPGVAAARSGPVFERPPSAVEVDRIVGADRALPADGESVEDLLAACAAVLAGGRRTTPAFFGYVQSPPAPVGVAADLLASAADQNLTSWRAGPTPGGAAHPTPRWVRPLSGFAQAPPGGPRRRGGAAPP